MRFILLLVLLGVSSLFAINSVYALEANYESIDLSASDSVDLVIMGNLNNYQSSTRLILTIVSPDGSTNDYDVRTSGKGAFSETFTITNDWKYGKYSVTGKYGDTDLGSTSFVIEEPYDPRIGMITSPKSTEIIEESVKTPEKIVETSESSEIPDWVRNIALWYGQRSVSETEFINAVKFLIENKIIVVDSLTAVESVPKTTESTPEPTKVFPDPNVDPQTYVDRYLNEQSYRDWFERNYPNKTIYEVVGLPEPTKVFPDPNVDPQTYVDRYLNEQSYRDWFERNYPNKTIYEVVGLPEPAPSVTVTTPTKKSDPNILSNSEFDVVFSDPDQYKGRWAKISGEIIQIIKDSDEISYVITTSSSADLSKRVWLTTSNSNLDLQEDHCYVTEGKIIGGIDFTLYLTGATSVIPAIELEKYKEISCLDAKFPAIKSIKVDQTQTKQNMKVTVKTIDIADEHTRVFVQVENLGNPDQFYFYGSESIIIQDKKQFREKYLFGVTYDDVESSIPEGVIESGYIILDPIEQKSFKLILKGSEWLNTGYGEYAEHKFEFNINLK